MKRALLVLGLLVALGGGAWAVYAFGPETMGGPKRVDLGEVPLAQLDTVSLARRVVTASVTGHVVEEADEEVIVSDGSGTFPVRLDEAHGVRENETLLAVGRVRQPRGGGARWLDARAWSEIEAAIEPLQAGLDSVRLEPDSTALQRLIEEDSARLAGEENRSREARDRSAEDG